ncbi:MULTISPECIES: ketoacyl-ACP synthase III [unclassified Undibacterium]|uniref:ketoacyl-ACP synthase III n=2 Tax=unclassified Undibacterium TaxID=2630295 RepID=UPI002AC93DCE|nr:MULTISPECIES: ketoacyl-ACP synthase III [unclassified Undibacterium]MEB0216507.1 ketoacyl-ACP synthase III [Undibacterium sp. 5I2]WPX44063.1 ketoacyl-ACP synthase III [Undibacterium sp. CCC3.4]
MLMSAKISAIEYHLPAAVLSNEVLADTFPEWSAEKIFDKTGIVQRHLAAAEETALDLAVAAAEKLFSADPAQREQIDFLLFCTQTPDYLLPTSACVIHQRLQLNSACAALDINLGCSGFVYGLSLARALIVSGEARRVLLLTGDTYSKLIHPLDRSVRVLFGDAAAATLIVAEPTLASALPPSGPFVLGTDGSGASNLMVPAGAARTPRSAATAAPYSDSSGNVRSAEQLFMDGPEILSFTLSAVPKVVAQVLQKAGKTLDQIDHVVFHQANGFILEALRKKIKIPREKFIIEFDSVGNTVSSSIPIALKRAKDKGQLQSGEVLLLVGFGVGYSWGAGIVTMF